VLELEMGTGQRLGDLLLGRKLVSTEQLEKALSAQVVHGARIGTNLVEQGSISLDVLTTSLAVQHSVPTVAVAHLEQISTETRTIVPAAVVARYGVLPLRYESPSQLHLAMLDPHHLDLIDEVGAILGVAMVHPYVVAELRFHRLAELHYQIVRPKRFLRGPGEVIEQERRSYLEPTPPKEPASAEEPASVRRLTDEFDLVVTLDGFDEPEPAPEKAAPVARLEDDPWADLAEEMDSVPEGDAPEPPGQEAARPTEAPPPEEPDYEAAIERIEQATDRRSLVERLLQPLVPGTELSILFTLRDKMAVAVGASGAGVQLETISELVVPLSSSDALQRALAERNVVRIEGHTDPLQQMISRHIGRAVPEEVCLVPIAVDEEAVNVLCVHSSAGFVEDALEDLAMASIAAAHTYRRLMKQQLVRPTTTTREVPAVCVAASGTEADSAVEASASSSGSISSSDVISLEVSFAGELDESSFNLPVEAATTRPAKQLKLIPRNKSKFARYTLICRLASGGMANVYLAQLAGQKGFEKLVAIKRIHEHLSDEEEFIEMFVDEARLAARISHPNVAQILEFDTWDDSFFIAMEYVDGEALNALLRRSRPKHQLVARLIANAAAGLHAAHELRDDKGRPMQVVHRDVSPQNILISYQGEVKVVDFGVARAQSNLRVTNVGTLKGKFSYMSPEQIQSGTLDRRADVFALGIILYESTTYKRLFKADTEQDTMKRVLQGEITPPSKVQEGYSLELEEIVMKALDRDRTQRYQSAEEMQAALEMYLMTSGGLVLASAVGKLMRKTFRDRMKEKERILEAFKRDRS
jgi:tRNA A-37 threonylcarbamoyl transferase component Bud32